MKEVPPTPEDSKSPSPEYPEYPWLPNTHRDRPSPTLHTQCAGENGDATSHPINVTPDTPTGEHQQRFLKHDVSPFHRMSNPNSSSCKTAQKADKSFQPAIQSIEHPESLPAESADDECEDSESSSEATPKAIDPLCTAVDKCVANSGDHRKVVSHIFGRNKLCTSQIPSDCWIFYCRKHYQRHRFRAKGTGWKRTQFDIIKRQLVRLETWGGVIDWEIALRKKERDELAVENRRAILNNIQPDYRESFLEPYLGRGKSYRDIDNLLDVIENEINLTGADDLPGFELLPNIDKKLYPSLKAARSAPKKTSHLSKSNTSSKRKRATKVTTPLTAANAKPTIKGRRLTQASEMLGTLEPTKDETAATTASNTKLHATDANPSTKRRRLARASAKLDTPEPSTDATVSNSPLLPNVEGFQAVNSVQRGQHTLPLRSARSTRRNSNARDRDDIGASQHRNVTDEA